jgi:hypothetical protein
VVGDADDIIMTNGRNVSAIAAGGSSAATTSPRVPAATAPGLYYVCATADANGAVAERNETNNALCSTERVQVTQ